MARRFTRLAVMVAVSTVVLTGCGGKKEKGVSGSTESGDSSRHVEAMESGAKAEDGAKFTDSRDGKTYKTVKVGGKTWMAENLNFAAEDSKCYENNAGNCEKYGRLYNWATALKACPAGFHLPTDGEWTALENAVGGRSTAGTKLKSAAGWNENGNGTNDFGFSALPGGNGDSGGDFYYAGSSGFWWSATESHAIYAWYRYVDDNKVGNVYRYYNDETYLFSVRCVAD